MSNSQQPHYLQTQFAQQQQPKSIIDYNQRQNQVLGKYNFDYSQQQQSYPSMADEIKTADIGRSLTMPNNNNKSVDVTTTNGQNSNIWQQPSVEMQPHPFSKTPQFREQEQRSQPYPQVNLSHNLPLGQQIGIHNNNGSHMNNLSAQSTPLANNFNESLLGNFQNIYQQQQQQPQQLTQQQQLQLLSQLLANSNNNPAVQQQRPQEQQQQFQVRPSVQPQLNNLQFQAHSQNFNPPVNNQLYLQQLLAQQQLQQRQQQLQTAEHSLLNTPLESSRYSQQQPVQQEQQQYFAQNYQQIHDNLNQYKKLISYLENIETAKRTGTNFQNNTPNILPPQMQQMSTLSPMLSSQQQQRVDNFQNINNPSYNGMYDTVNSSIINLQPEEKIRPVQETLPLQQSFVMTSQESTPHQQKITTEPENAQILWPSSGSTNIELKSNRTFVQPSQNIANGFDNYNQLNQSQFNPISYDNNIEYENNQLSESYIDQKLTAINMDIQMKQNNNNNIQILDVCQQHENDMSKASAEITKESLTEAQLQQITSEDNNKSLLNVNDGEQHFGMGNLSSQSHNSNHYNQNSDNNGTNNLNNDGNFSTSNDQLIIRDSEIVPIQADKPIVNHQMTFEELLESKLQEDMAAYEEKKNENLKPVVQQQPPKREFLRKSSNNRGTNGQENEQSKSKNKYKYYVDNFNNNGGSTNNITNTTNTSSQNVQKQGHNNFATPLGEAQSPKATTQCMRRTTIENSASNKKLLSTQKSNQKQPRQQQPANKQTQRPQSQQQMTTQSVSNNNTASKNTARNRQNNMTPHISSLNVINEKDNIKGSQSEAPLTDEPISERNSVIEFEMLEQECIEKYNQQQQQKQKQEMSSEKQVSNQQPQTQERSINNSASRKPIQQKEQQQQKEQLPPKVIDKQLQKVMEKKVQELDKEIQKFQKENKRVASMQEECEAQLKRINTEIEEFQLRKDDEMEDIEQWKHDQRIIIKKERQQLENEKELFNRNQLTNIDQQSSEVERLMARINQLESENFDLKDRLDELTDKELHCIGVQTTPAKIYDAYTMTEELQPIQVSQVDKNISPLKEQNFEPAIINQAKTNTIQLKTHSVYEDNMCHPIEQITEEDEDNFSKTNSEQPAEEGEQSPIHEGEESHPQEIAGSDEDEEEDEYDLKFPSEYHGNTQKSVLVVEEVVGHDGKVQKIYANGKKEVLFTNGVKREVWPDGYSIVYFNNNDIKQTYADGKIVYYFSEAKTTQSTYPNGLQVFKFANSQIEKHFADGTKEISFPDGTIKCLFPDGEEESIFPDGTIQKIEKNGVRIVEFPNGQRDVLYPDGTKVREFEDGSVKKIYNDGKIEILQSAHKVARNLHRK